MPNGNITLADITSADWSLMLDSSSAIQTSGGGIGNVVQGVADINQCIGIILATPKGSDPLRPTFACDMWRWVDAPIQEARAHLVREIVESITIWEPRVRVLSVVVNLVAADPSANVNAHLDVTIVWQLKVSVSGPGGPNASQQLTVTVPMNLA